MTAPATLLKKESLKQVFSCEFCEIFKNTVSYRTPPVAAYEFWQDFEIKQTDFCEKQIYLSNKNTHLDVAGDDNIPHDHDHVHDYDLGADSIFV